MTKLNQLLKDDEANDFCQKQGFNGVITQHEICLNKHLYDINS